MTGHPRSRWIFLVLALGTAAVCVALGVWQFRRHQARRALNGVATEHRARPPVVYPTRGLEVESQVIMTGRFDLEHEFVLRGRAHDGAPGVEIATPFRVAGSDTAVIVVRGFVPSDDAMSVDLVAIADTGVRTIRGITFVLPERGIPVERRGDTTWDRIPGEWIATHLPYPVARYALWQERDSTTGRLPIRVGAPALTEGPHFNYMLQWFAFAIIFAGGGIAYTFRKREERGENATS